MGAIFFLAYFRRFLFNLFNKHLAGDELGVRARSRVAAKV